MFQAFCSRTGLGINFPETILTAKKKFDVHQAYRVIAINCLPAAYKAGFKAIFSSFVKRLNYFVTYYYTEFCTYFSFGKFNFTPTFEPLLQQPITN